MIITTTSTVETHKIVQYCGLVTGETIIGANVVRDIFASITDVLGGRSGAYEKSFAEARELATQEMQQRAAEMGADAIVGVDLDYEVINNMLMVSATGTAVKLG